MWKNNELNVSSDNRKNVKEEFDDDTKGEGCGEAVDSGFITGPQTLLEEEDFFQENSVEHPRNQSTSKTSEKTILQGESDYLDSGCIEEEPRVDKQKMPVDTLFSNLSLKPKETSSSAPWEIYYQQNNDGDTQMHLACITGYVDVVVALIRFAPHSCLFNIQNDEAQTALHLAVLKSKPKIVRMLLIAGAEPLIRDRNGNTPLHLACESGDLQCVKALTIPISSSEIQEAHRMYGHRSLDKTTSYLRYPPQLPFDLEIRNYEGERCVHLAAQEGHIDVLRHLVWFGADINAREGKSGRTALHIAIEVCNEILANFLLDECSKINIETVTYAGLTPYQFACILNNSEMQDNLEQRGAEPLTPPDSENDSDSDDIDNLDDSQNFDSFGDPGYFISFNSPHSILIV